jgi:hypothetical protein
MSKKMRFFCAGVCSFFLLSIVTVLVPASSYGFDILIEVAPSTLNIRNLGEVVTIHTNIAYDSVKGDTVSVVLGDENNEIGISWWKADNQGEFVAKFEMSEVQEAVETILGGKPGEITITLTGETTDEEATTFTGEQTITVINSGRK